MSVGCVWTKMRMAGHRLNMPCRSRDRGTLRTVARAQHRLQGGQVLLRGCDLSSPKKQRGFCGLSVQRGTLSSELVSVKRTSFRDIEGCNELSTTKGTPAWMLTRDTMFGKTLSAHQLRIARFALAGGAADRPARPSVHTPSGFSKGGL